MRQLNDFKSSELSRCSVYRKKHDPLNSLKGKNRMECESPGAEKRGTNEKM